MTNFDGTVDNRWRPDLEFSQRRVREEEQDDLVVQSRELSFVPSRRKGFQPHDPQTTALIRRFKELESLPHGAAVSRLLSDWDWKDKMEGVVEKQRFLESLIDAVRRDPAANEHLVIFLMLVFEPVRRGVSKAFVSAHAGLAPQQRDVNWGNREEARMIRHIEREQLFDVTREAALEAVFRYPSPPPPRFFLWLRETIAHRALDKLKGRPPGSSDRRPARRGPGRGDAGRALRLRTGRGAHDVRAARASSMAIAHLDAGRVRRCRGVPRARPGP
jgi:hypothetical protein